MWTDEMIERVEALEAEEARLSAALLDMAAERDVALAKADRLRAMLLRLEWGDRGWCLVCDQIDPACRDGSHPSNCGHKADCALHLLLWEKNALVMPDR